MSASSLFPPAMIVAEKRNGFDPLPSLSPELLASQIAQFRSGQLRPLAMTMDAIEERDDLLAAVVPKAKAAPTIHGWEINTVETRSRSAASEAQRQREVLTEFYNNLRVTDAMEQDLLGDVKLLLRQMMDAKGKRYAVHNVVWKSLGRRRYTATFWRVPLRFCEATTGKLRFLDQPHASTGRTMQPGEWLVTVGTGLMIACAVAWMYKRPPLRDWLIYCSRHGMPGFEGITDAPEGSAEWQKLVAAVKAAAGGEFAWIRSQNQSINVVDFGAEGELPYPELVDRMDRAMSAIWRGADLSTISSGTPDARGASLQGKEAAIIEAADAQWLSGQLNMSVDRYVLDYVFGPGTPQLAYFHVLTRQKDRVTLDLKIDEFAISRGHPISRTQFAERYNRPVPADGQKLLGQHSEGER